MIIIGILCSRWFRDHDLFDGQHRRASATRRRNSPADWRHPVGLGPRPFAILLFIDFVIMGIPAYHAVIDMEDTKTKAGHGAQGHRHAVEMAVRISESGVKFISNMSDTA